MIEQTVEELTPLIGTRPACRALGASPATIYRRRRPPEPKPQKPRPRPARALSDAERDAVLAELHSERFVDSSPEAGTEGRRDVAVKRLRRVALRLHRSSGPGAFQRCRGTYVLATAKLGRRAKARRDQPKSPLIAALRTHTPFAGLS